LSAPPHDPVFFIDRDLGSRTFPAILRAAGLRVEAHDDHFPDERSPAPDHVWLRLIAERRWIGVTHDARIRYTSRSRDELMRFGAQALILKGGASPQVLAENFVRTYPRVLRFLRQNPEALIAKIYRNDRDPAKGGRIEMWLSYRDWVKSART
jgi:hypothetical protein